MDLKILHITNWYPGKATPYTALWIKRHIDSISKYTEYKVYHIQIFKGRLSVKRVINDDKSISYLLYLPFLIWRLNEFLYFLYLCYILFIKENLKNYNRINFHIAYPILTYYHFIKRFISIPVFVTEHWSGYHFNFGSSKNLKRIKRIFKNNFNWIVVSKALANDLKNFSQRDIKEFILPNIVSDEKKLLDNVSREIDRVKFFMVSQWQRPKDPVFVLNCFKELLETNPELYLNIAGYGDQENEILQFIENNKLGKNIKYLFKINGEQICREMNEADAFIHASQYETFSVVCAEANACGCPVIAPEVGGILEFINKDNGLFYTPGDSGSFKGAVQKFILTKNSYNRIGIARNAMQFRSNSVGEKYISILTQV